ncbi:hypothetical protein C9374_005327 [Naegleria lovaniensis]|uniref:Uncharacterized protein n=1 Tax=Naegleria lovaniensis TaxID=51637 RepID=A0AA88GR18_NAELO|nr:uncharacterized protein C9374_005327 [Naegleria lovaniensis]KAG2382747.1 hypothetical protein C9374_005327 [Naegleria lovaniensis]
MHLSKPFSHNLRNSREMALRPYTFSGRKESYDFEPPRSSADRELEEREEKVGWNGGDPSHSFSSGLIHALKSSFASNFVPLHHTENTVPVDNRFNHHGISNNVKGNLQDFSSFPIQSAISTSRNISYNGEGFLGHQPLMQNNNKTISHMEGLSRKNHQEEVREQSEEDDCSDHLSSDPNTSTSLQNSSHHQLVNTTLNSTFSEMFTRLLGREKRRPQCTAPIRTVIVVQDFLKEQYEKQVELEKVSKSQQYMGEHYQDKKSVCASGPTDDTSVPTVHDLKEEEVLEGEEISRNPSLAPCIRSVSIHKKDMLLGEEEHVRTRFLGERDLERYLDIEGTNYRKSRKSKLAGTTTKTDKPRDHVKQQSDEFTHENDFQKPTKSRRVFLPESVQQARNHFPSENTTPADNNESKHQRSVVPSSKTTNTSPQKPSKTLQQEKARSSFHSDPASSSSTLMILSQENISHHNNVVKWIERDLGISMSSTLQCENELKNGLKLAEIVGRIESEERMKGMNKQPQTNAAFFNNVERVLSVLRENKAMELRYLWSVKEINAGNPEVIWGLLSDIFDAYRKRTSKVKTKSRRKMQQDISKEDEMVEKIEEISKHVHSNQVDRDLHEERRMRESGHYQANDEVQITDEGFSIEEINRMKQELLNSVISDE